MSDKEISQQAAPQDEDLVEVVHVDLEDGEVKGADKADKEGEKCDKKGKKSSKAWDYFEEIKGCPVGFEKAQCRFCKVIIGCNTNRNGTSAMMNHLKTVCAKSPLRTNLDKLQKTLKFEKLSKDENLKGADSGAGTDLGMGADFGVKKAKKKKKKLVEGAPFYVDFDNVIRFIQFLKI